MKTFSAVLLGLVTLSQVMASPVPEVAPEAPGIFFEDETAFAEWKAQQLATRDLETRDLEARQNNAPFNFLAFWQNSNRTGPSYTYVPIPGDNVYRRVDSSVRYAMSAEALYETRLGFRCIFYFINSNGLGDVIAHDAEPETSSHYSDNIFESYNSPIDGFRCSNTTGAAGIFS